MTGTTTTDTATSWLPRGRSLVVDDLEAAPDDGHRYELIDGLLVVSPGPVPAHQGIVVELAVLLRLACPPDLKVFVAPLDVVLATDTILQPDVLVVRRSDVGPRNVPAAPVLAVEVLSPSTRGVDLLLKKERLQRAGCASYWVVDPAGDGTLQAWDLDGTGHYVPVAEVAGGEPWTATLPFAVTVTPAVLLG